MISPIRRISRHLLVLIAIATIWREDAEAQQSEWVNHINPNLISEIVMRDGELYCATSGGLLVYQPDDSTFEQFTNTIGLPTSFLTCLAFDSKGSLWVGTDRLGIARLDFVPGGFDVSTFEATGDGIADDRITTVTAWGDSVVYGTKAGAGLIVAGFPSSRFPTDSLPSEEIADVFVDGDFLWFATDNGVARRDRLGFTEEVSNGLPSLNAHVFARDDTALWVGTSAGLAYLDDSGGTWIPAGLGTESIFSIKFGGQKLWAASNSRLFENDGSGWITHSFVHIFHKYGLNSQAETRGLQPMVDGTVYMGTGQVSRGRGGYLLLFDGTTVRDLRANAPTGRDLRRSSFDIDGSLWVSSASFGVGKLTPSGTWFNYNPAVGDTNLSTRSTNLALLADSQGSKWFCSLWRPLVPEIEVDQLEDGLDLSYENDIWTHHDIGSGGGDGLGSLRHHRAMEDPAGNRWFLHAVDPGGTAPDEWRGISILSEDGNEWRHITPTSTNLGMQVGDITDVTFGPGGVVWVADVSDGVREWRTGGYDKASLFDLSGDVWTHLGTVADDFDGGDVSAVTVRSDGVVWVGTKAGVYGYENGLFRRFQAKRGLGGELLSNAVMDLALDHDENLWVATDLGLNRISRDDEREILSFTTQAAWRDQLSLFFPDQKKVVSALADALCHALTLHPTQNLLYIATAGGLSILDLSSLEPGPTDLSKVYLYPNPIRPRRGHTMLKIANHNSPVDIEIYTLEGELVHAEENVRPNEREVWDLTTESGFFAASGVYLVRISADTGTVVRTISLIR